MFKITEKPIHLKSAEEDPNISKKVVSMIKANAKTTDAFEKEVETIEKSSRDILLDMLDISDSLDRTIQQIQILPENETTQKITGYVTTTLQQLSWLLQRRGVISFDTVGNIADPSLTEIMGEEVSSEYKEDTVIRETAKGYLYNGRVLRQARVIVAGKKEINDD